MCNIFKSLHCGECERMNSVWYWPWAGRSFLYPVTGKTRSSNPRKTVNCWIGITQACSMVCSLSLTAIFPSDQRFAICLLLVCLPVAPEPEPWSLIDTSQIWSKKEILKPFVSSGVVSPVVCFLVDLLVLCHPAYMGFSLTGPSCLPW